MKRDICIILTFIALWIAASFWYAVALLGAIVTFEAIIENWLEKFHKVMKEMLQEESEKL